MTSTTTTNKGKTKHSWKEPKPFSEWPPLDHSGWLRERPLRISPKIGSLIHHHPRHLLEIIKHFVNLIGKPVMIPIINTLLKHQLPIDQLDFIAFIPKTEIENTYLHSLASHYGNIHRAHPADLYRIILSLISNKTLIQITEHNVQLLTKSITSRESGVRQAFRNKKRPRHSRQAFLKKKKPRLHVVGFFAFLNFYVCHLLFIYLFYFNY